MAERAAIDAGKLRLTGCEVACLLFGSLVARVMGCVRHTGHLNGAPGARYELRSAIGQQSREIRRGPQANLEASSWCLVAGKGFEPLTFGL